MGLRKNKFQFEIIKPGQSKQAHQLCLFVCLFLFTVTLPFDKGIPGFWIFACCLVMFASREKWKKKIILEPGTALSFPLHTLGDSLS